MKVEIPDNQLDVVKAPVHGNIMRWAEENLSDIMPAIKFPN